MASILIVEDDALIRRLYEKVFSSEGHKVSTAADGEEGLLKIKEEKPALILLDIMMPKMDGLELLERIKADPEIADIPVVVLTNLAGTKDAETALSKGAVKYIVKSGYKPKEIVGMVKEILAGYTRGDIPKVGGKK